jgi:molecular chaperone HscB
VSYFEVFEIPPALALDLKDLEKRFYALSRKLHPDLRRNPAERAEAEEATAVLNDAYRTLRDPIRRAEYLLRLEGFDIGEQTTKDVPPELLEEVFEINMALEEADAEQVDSARQKFEGTRGDIDEEILHEFGRWDQTRDREALVSVRGLLNRRKYITNLITTAQSHVPDRV